MADIKYADKEDRMLKLARATRDSPFTDDPTTDPRNFFGAKLEDVPPFHNINVIKMEEIFFNKDGYRVPLRELQTKEKET